MRLATTSTPLADRLHTKSALGHRLAYQHDRHGRLATLTNENGALYRFGCDTADRLISEQGFDARRIDYRYNACSAPNSYRTLSEIVCRTI